jgi:hypothetical protein
LGDETFETIDGSPMSRDSRHATSSSVAPRCAATRASKVVAFISSLAGAGGSAWVGEQDREQRRADIVEFFEKIFL